MKRTLGLIIMFYIISNLTYGNNPLYSEDCNASKSLQSSVDGSKAFVNLNTYPRFSEYVATMKQFATSYPDLCELIVIGHSTQGREILAVKISDNVTCNEAEPEFLYTSSMHGDELTGYPLMLKLIEELLTKYNTDQEITNLVNNTQIFINPLANPDGAYGDIHSKRADIIHNPIRENINHIDLNRNYPDDIKGLHVYSKSFEAETKAFMQFEAKHNFVLAANLHSGEEVTNYPWDNKPSSDPHPDHHYFEHVCKSYATQTQKDSPKHFFEFDPDAYLHKSKGVTHGASWYLVHGSRQDYMNYYRHTKEITIEMSKEKFPKAKELRNYWMYHRQALLNFIKEANNGLQGTITDVLGYPVEAKITINNYDKHNSWIRSNEDLGDYYRLLSEGMYQITYTAPGYKTQTKYVLIKNGEKTVENVILSPLKDSFASLRTTTSDLALNLDNAMHTKWYNKTPQTFKTYHRISEIGDSKYYKNGVYSNAYNYIEFNSRKTIKLNEVTINASNSGTLEVQLLNAQNKVLDSKIIFVDAAGIQTINLEFIIPKGTHFKLALKDTSEGIQLHCNANDASFPYYNNDVTLIQSNRGSAFYPYFYDWKFEAAPSVIDTNLIPYNNFTYIFNPKNQAKNSLDDDTSKPILEQGK